LEIRIAHYPPYTSKYNPIEHRLFPHVTRACRGAIFTSLAVVKRLMERTHTSQGLSVTVQIIDKVYETGRKVAQSFKQNLPILFDDFLPQWNYRAVPNAQAKYLYHFGGLAGGWLELAGKSVLVSDRPGHRQTQGG
jgi:Rhodopirellula transposase DDE domain